MGQQPQNCRWWKKINWLIIDGYTAKQNKAYLVKERVFVECAQLSGLGERHILEGALFGLLWWRMRNPARRTLVRAADAAGELGTRSREAVRIETVGVDRTAPGPTRNSVSTTTWLFHLAPLTGDIG